MKTLSNCEMGALFEQPACDFGVVVVYGDFVAGLRAKQILDGVTVGSNIESEPSAHWWRLDLLQYTPFRALAANQAAAADLVFFSANEDPNQLQQFESWSQEWLRTRAHTGALVLALPLEARQAIWDAGTLTRLGGIAYQAGMTLFAHFGELPDHAATGTDASSPQASHPFLNMQPFPATPMQEAPFIRGGINE